MKCANSLHGTAVDVRINTTLIYLSIKYEAKANSTFVKLRKKKTVNRETAEIKFAVLQWFRARLFLGWNQ